MSEWSTRPGKTFGANGPHVPNKNEAKVLRRLMSETGLTEEQLRQHKKYRKILSEAQDAGETKLTPEQKRAKAQAKVLKTVTRRLQLPKEHPLVIEAYEKEIARMKLSPWTYERKIVEAISK